MFVQKVKNNSSRKLANSALSCSLAIFLTACGGSSGGLIGTEGSVAGTDTDTNLNTPTTDNATGEIPAGCSVAGINLWINERMRDDYIYYDSVPVVNLDDYTDPAKLVDDLRVDPDVYTSLVDAQQNQDLIENSSVPPRFGFWVDTATDGRYHFSDISGNSPMDVAGIKRGDVLVAINGVPYEDITDDQWQEFVRGEADERLTAVFTVKTGADEPRDISVTKDTYIEKTVPVYGTLTQANGLTGYIKLDAFRSTSEAELDTAVEYLISQNVSELILDLRYNGGGFTRVARKLASQIVGQDFVGEVYSRRVFNDKYSIYNSDQFIEEQALNLNLSRLVVLTTGASASASETLINGVKPFIDTIVIGGVTVGKPYTSVAQDYCGKRLNAMSTITTNGVGVSVIDGIKPVCEVADDYLASADSTADALTGAAFNYIENGTCPVVQSSLAQSKRRTISGVPELH